MAAAPVALKKAKLDEAQHSYDRMKGGADEDQLKVLQARLDAAKAGEHGLLLAGGPVGLDVDGEDIRGLRNPHAFAASSRRSHHSLVNV